MSRPPQHPSDSTTVREHSRAGEHAPLLLTLSAGKFALVVMFFMHLRYDSRVLTFLFVAPLVLAVLLSVAVMTLTGEFLVFRR